MENKSINIKSLQASSLWENEHRQFRPIPDLDEYRGSLPYSLESIKLRETGMKVFSFNQQPATDDLINIKFDQKVRSGQSLLKSIPQWIEWKVEAIGKVEDKLSMIQKVRYKQRLVNDLMRLTGELESLNNLKNELESNGDNVEWDEVKLNDLRTKLYTEGFHLDVYDRKKKKYVNTKFVLYKRTTAKSRNGNVWFIRKSLHDEMSSWSNLRLDFSKDKADLTGIMAYESLVASTIVDTLKIDPESILMVDKVVSRFNDKKVNVIGLKDDKLDCEPKYHHIENELFDGSAMLDASMFKGAYEAKGYLQLRGAYFKCAAFNVDLQQMFKDEFGEDYNTATVKDMWGREVNVSSIRLIVNPSCLKALKYAYATNDSKLDMWEHWKSFTKDEMDSQFGICRWEKHTKRTDKDLLEEGHRYQKMSYQMINSLPSNPSDIGKLADFEVEYIEQLKNNPERLMKYLERTKNKMNANQMFIDIYNVNPGIVESKIFRNFKKNAIRKYRESVQSGEVRVRGDYCIMAANLPEYMLAALGKIKGEITDSVVFKENEIFTPLFPAGEVVGFRNPHVAPGNIIRLHNIRPDLEDDHDNPYHRYFKYINATSNIAIVSACHNLLLDILNGCDFDGDSLLLTDSKEILSMLDKVKVDYLVPVNAIPLKSNSKDVEYTLDNESKARVDIKGSRSQARIGSITNLAQLSLSIMWNEINSSQPDDNKVKELLDMVNALAVCSGLAIDGAKREYAVDVDKQISHFNRVLSGMMYTYTAEYVNSKTGEITEKEEKVFPKFWRYVKEDNNKALLSETDNSKNGRPDIYYNTPMDWLFHKFEKLDRGIGKRGNRTLEDLLVNGRVKDGDRRKQANIEQLAKESQSASNKVFTSDTNSDEGVEEMLNEAEQLLTKYDRKLTKIKVDDKTMHALLAKISRRTEKKNKDKTDDEKAHADLRLMLHLYNGYKELLLAAFNPAVEEKITKNVHLSS